MISAWWLLPALMTGAVLGILTAGLCMIAADSDSESK